MTDDYTEIMVYCRRGIHVQVEGEDEQQFTLDEARQFADEELDGTEVIAEDHPTYDGKYTARSVIHTYADGWDSDVPRNEQARPVPIEEVEA